MMTDEKRTTGAVFGRAILTVIAVYVLMLGGTFTGVLLVETQLLSLSLLTIGATVWLVLLWWRPVPVSGASFDLALALWVVAIGVSAILHMSGRVAIAVWWAGLYAATWLSLTDLRQRGLPSNWVINAVLIAAVPVMLLAVAQVQGWYAGWVALDSVPVAYMPPRPPSTLGNANALGTVLAMLLPVSIARLRYARQPLMQVLLGVWIAGAVLVLYLTFSRGAWLAAVAGVTALWGLSLSVQHTSLVWEWWRQRSRRMRVSMFVLGVVAGIVAVSMLLVSARAFETPRRDPGTRLFLWQVAWDTFREYPVVGRGPGTYGLSLLERWSFPPEHPHAGAHNLILNIAAELGALGLTALVVTIGLIAWHGWQAVQQANNSDERTYRAACLGGLVALGVHSMVDIPLIVPAIVLLALGLLAVGIHGPKLTSGRGTTMSRYHGRLRFASATVLWIGVLLSGWWSARIYTHYAEGQQALADGDLRSGVSILKEIAQTRPELALYHAEYGYACGLTVYTGDLTCAGEGVAAYRRALELEPQHAVWWANLAALHWDSGQPSAAVGALRQAVHYAPEAADFWLALGVYQEALGWDKAAFDAYRRALDAHEEWAYIAFWQTTPVRQYARLTSGLAPSPYERALFLWDAGSPEAAIEVLDSRIERDPSQPRPYVQLARLHVANGALGRAEEYLDAARLLVHTQFGEAWIAVVEAEIARAHGDLAGHAAYMREAQSIVSPGDAGYTLLYGRDVAYFHFWRARIAGMLLPQLPIYGHDPQLTERVHATHEGGPLPTPW